MKCITLIAFHATGADGAQPRHFATLRPPPYDARIAIMASTDAPKLSPDLQQIIRAAPAATVHLLLRVAAFTEQAEETLVAAGFQIQRRLTLVPIFAVSGPAAGVTDLLDQPWLISAELDRPVHIH